MQMMFSLGFPNHVLVTPSLVTTLFPSCQAALQTQRGWAGSGNYSLLVFLGLEATSDCGPVMV